MSKRWIYWKRRYADPTPKDWVLLGCLIIAAAGIVSSIVDFRIGALTLACAPVGLAVIRLLPRPWSEVWANRGRGVDVLTLLALAGVLVLLAFIIPTAR